MKKIFFILFCLCLNSSLFAETIVLKSGKTVEAKIIEKNNDSIKVDLYGTSLTYYLEDIESIDGKSIDAIDGQPKVNDRNQSQSSSTKFFNDSAFGLSFEYPSNWEMTPKDKLENGMNVGLQPKERSTVNIVFQYDYLPEETIKENSSLKDFLAEIFPPEGFKVGSITPLTFDKVSGCLVKLLPEKKLAISFKNIEGAQGTVLRPFINLADYYFFTNAFAPEKKDKRFVMVGVKYIEYFPMSPEIDNPNNREALRNYELKMGHNDDNKKTTKYCEEAKKIIDSLRFPWSR